MDVHKEAIVIAVLNGSGKLVMETILETKAGSILQFIHGLRGELHVTWEEGTWAAWLYDLLQPQVQEVVVCNPRRDALLKEGSKSDKVDARKLADLLRTRVLERQVDHYPSPCMGAIRSLAVYIAMTFLRRVVMLSRSRKFVRYPEAMWANCAFGTIQASIALLVVLSVVHPAFAANPDLETVLTGSRQRIEKLDYRATGRLTRVEGNGKRTSYKFVAKAHWFPDGLRLLCEISGPGSEEKTSLLLHMSLSGHVTIEAVLPGEKAASALPFERWNDPLVGTDFSYEDMVENQFFWKNQELLAPDKYGARDCFVLKSMPGPQDRTHHDSVTSWIDRGILYPVHVAKTLRGTGQQKEFIYYGLRQVGGAWSASQVEAKLQGKPGSSILAIEWGSGRANLGRKDFDIGQSSAQGEKVK